MDAGLAAIFITVLLALIGMGVAWGMLKERVNNNKSDILNNRMQNTTEHQQIFDKLDIIQRGINGGK